MVAIVAVHLILSPIVCISTYRSITTLIVFPPVIAALNRSTRKSGNPKRLACVPETGAIGFAGPSLPVNACILSSISTVESDSLACMDTIIDAP